MKTMNIETLRRHGLACAVLDMLCEPEWAFRQFSYDPAWGEGEQLGSWRNGSGAQLFYLFHPRGVFVKGFNHESLYGARYMETDTIPQEILKNLTPADHGFLAEPAFSKECSFLLSATELLVLPADLDTPAGQRRPGAGMGDSGRRHGQL